MSSITDIKQRILVLAAAQFQEFCDTLLHKMGYGVVHGLGMKSGTGNTTIGNPDTYFRNENGKYILVAYTIQQSKIYSKLKEDIDKCLDPSKTGLDVADIEEIICCHTSSNLSAGDDKKLHDLCESQGIALTIFGIDEIANQVHNRYRSLAKDYLGINIDTNQILRIDDFITQYDANGISAPLNTVFQYRENEKNDIINSLQEHSIVIVTGKAGVGKTRLVLETARAFAITHKYKLLCVKNNNLGIYNDLVSATEQTDKYLFFIDDANELSELSLILAYTIKEYVVKIIVTVRDYAKEKVIDEVKKYTKPKIIEVLSFLDDEIKGFLNENLKIRNEDYVKQIIQIAEGNPRIAYMAGRLAVEKQNLSAINDVSQLYDAYYEKYVDETLGSDKNLCFVAGILSIVNAIVLDQISVFQDLIDNYGISLNDFKEKILQLSKLEVVEIKLDQVATLSDQCLSNYLLYYIFFHRKIIPLSTVLEIGYKYFRNGVIKSVNIILNLFKSEETSKYCKQEILKVWDNFKKNHDRCFENYVKDFHVFRPEEAFLLAQEKIEAINSEEINIFDVDFSKKVSCHEETILSYLTGYGFSDNLELVMELLLYYSGKNEETLVSGYKWLVNCYGFDLLAHRYNYSTQRKISAYLYNAITKGNDVAMAVGFQWAKYALAFSFQPTKLERENKFVVYNLKVKNEEGVNIYRQDCWNILISLAAKDIWHDKVLMYLDDYSKEIHEEIDRNVVIGDSKHIHILLSILECNRISFLTVIQRILFSSEKLNIEYDEKWTKLLSEKKLDLDLYWLLGDDYFCSDLAYEEYEVRRSYQITEYGKKLSLPQIPNLVQNLNEILLDVTSEQDAYNINQGIELMIQQLDDACLQEFLNSFIQYGANISIHPGIVLKKLNQTSDSVLLLSQLKEADFPQKNEWLFNYFNTLPEERVSLEMLGEFKQFLRSDLNKITISSSYRGLRVLDKFLSIEPNIYPIVCSLIYGKREYSNIIVELYFKQLFHYQTYSPEELLVLFKSNLTLLQEIYFYMIKTVKSEDYKGIFLIKFLSLEDKWLHKYAQFYCKYSDNNIDYDYCRNIALWKSENFMKYFDYIFYYSIQEGMNSLSRKYTIKKILTYVKNEELVKQHQQEWLVHIIIENSSSNLINTIFEIVCELNEDIRRKAIESFLNSNPDFESFKKLPLIPEHWERIGSIVPAYQKQIDFLESINTLVPGVKFLKHKDRIKKEIELLQKMKKKEEVEEISRSLYM